MLRLAALLISGLPLLTGFAGGGFAPGAPAAGHAPRPPRSMLRLTFQDTFSGDRIDPGKWTTCYPWFPPTGCTNEGNQELEWYLPGQVHVAGGVLSLEAVRHQVSVALNGGAMKTFPYRSGMVTTAGRFEFTYGVVQIVARLPRGRGYWPALWLLPTSRAWPPEIDLMEAFGSTPDRVALTYHRTRSSVDRRVVSLAAGGGGWHKFAVAWEPGSITWLIDGRRCFQVTGSVPRQPMYLLLDLAVSGVPAHAPDRTTPASAALLVSSVKIWTRGPGAPTG